MNIHIIPHVDKGSMAVTLMASIPGLSSIIHIKDPALLATTISELKNSGTICWPEYFNNIVLPEKSGD